MAPTTKTPSQQALLQFIESIIITAVIAGVVSISPLIVGTGPVNLNQVLVSFGLAVFFSLAHSLAAYLKALPAPQQPGSVNLTELGTVLDDFFGVVQQRLDSLYATTQAQAQAQQQQPVPSAPQPQPAAVHGPAGVVSVQPAQSAIPQQAIPAFTSTAQIAAIQQQPAQ